MVGMTGYSRVAFRRDPMSRFEGSQALRSYKFTLERPIIRSMFLYCLKAIWEFLNQTAGMVSTGSQQNASHMVLDLQKYLKFLPPLSIGWFLEFVPFSLGLSSFLDLEQFLEA